MNPYLNPGVYWASAMQFGLLAVEAQAVIGMRLLGMVGLWSVTGSENRRMVDEKAVALTKSMTNASAALLTGQTPNKIAEAAMRPLRQKTRSNYRRLAKRGPKSR